MKRRGGRSRSSTISWIADACRTRRLLRRRRGGTFSRFLCSGRSPGRDGDEGEGRGSDGRRRENRKPERTAGKRRKRGRRGSKKGKPARAPIPPFHPTPPHHNPSPVSAGVLGIGRPTTDVARNAYVIGSAFGFRFLVEGFRTSAGVRAGHKMHVLRTSCV